MLNLAFLWGQVELSIIKAAFPGSKRSQNRCNLIYNFMLSAQFHIQGHKLDDHCYSRHHHVIFARHSRTQSKQWISDQKCLSFLKTPIKAERFCMTVCHSGALDLTHRLSWNIYKVAEIRDGCLTKMKYSKQKLLVPGGVTIGWHRYQLCT